MCGIVAVWDRAAPATDEGVVRRMLAQIRHRGPDAEGVERLGDLSLGHCRLAILDLSQEAHQPQLSADRRFGLVYNGEVYNFRELRQELEQEGATFTSSGDAQVVLQALVRWGPKRAVERFNGMFAFAFFDAQSEELWLARDRLGIKPLNVALVGGRVLVASESKAFLSHPAFVARADLHAVSTLVVRGRVDAPWTTLDGVEGIEPGALWRITREGIERSRWFELLERLNVARLIQGGTHSPTQVVAAVEQALRSSVTAHLISDVPVATMCSGGVDSSLITALARESLPDLHAYVADVGGRDSEAQAALHAGRHLGVPVHVVRVDRETWLRRWAQMAWLREGSSFGASEVAHLEVALRCRADGIRVLLTGEGADELFGGYPWYVKARKKWKDRTRWRALMSEKRRARREQRESFSPLVDAPGRKDGSLRAHLCAGLQMSREVRGAAIWQRLAPMKSLADRAVALQGLEDLYTHLGSILMRHDRAGMGASLEMRVPFLENGVIDLGMHMHPRFKIRARQTKWALKQVALKYLPTKLVTAKKKGFPVPDAFHANASQLLKQGRVAELLRWDRGLEHVLLPQVEAQPELRYVLAGLEIWARLFLDGESVDQVGERVMAALHTPSPRSAPTSAPF